MIPYPCGTKRIDVKKPVAVIRIVRAFFNSRLRQTFLKVISGKLFIAFLKKKSVINNFFNHLPAQFFTYAEVLFENKHAVPKSFMYNTEA